MKYAIEFILTNTSKYTYVPYQHIYTEIRSYYLENTLIFALNAKICAYLKITKKRVAK